MLSRAGRLLLLLLGVGVLFAIGLGSWLLSDAGDLTPGPAATPDASAIASVAATADASIAAPSAAPADDAATLITRALDRDAPRSTLPAALRRRMEPAAAVREYFDSSGTFDYRSLDAAEVRAAERVLAGVLLERLTGAAHEQMRSLIVDYQSAPGRDPGASWLWRQEHAVESAALLEEVDGASRVSVVVRFTRWFAGGEKLRMRSSLILDLDRDAFGLWRISGWEALGDTLLP